jgi:hypothetical protein
MVTCIYTHIHIELLLKERLYILSAVLAITDTHTSHIFIGIDSYICCWRLSIYITHTYTLYWHTHCITCHCCCWRSVCWSWQILADTYWHTHITAGCIILLLPHTHTHWLYTLLLTHTHTYTYIILTQTLHTADNDTHYYCPNSLLYWLVIGHWLVG